MDRDLTGWVVTAVVGIATVVAGSRLVAAVGALAVVVLARCRDFAPARPAQALRS